MKYATILFSLIFGLNLMTQAQSTDQESELFVVLTSGEAEVQMMALVLATQSVNKEVPVRVLLCGEAGNLSLEGVESPDFKPADRSPAELLKGLVQRGVRADVCGIFLPNRPETESDLIEGVGVASPPEVAEYMKRENVRYFTF